MRYLAAPGLDEYGALVAARKACRICVERNPGSIRSCAEFDYDPDIVSHWEAWLGHKRPKLLAVGQDFGNVGYFVRNRGRDDPNNKTNDNLRKLLIEAGFDVTHSSRLDRSAPVFLTNSILCIKEGPMDGAVRPSWVDACADKHLRPLVDYLKPPIVVGMGSCGWRAVRRIFALENVPERISHAAGSSWVAADETRVFAVGHPGPQGLTNRPWPRQLADWRRIGVAVSTILVSDRRPDTLSIMDSAPCIRPARIEEAPALLELCARSKASWGYDDTFMALVRIAFEGMQEQVAAGDVWVATGADGTVAGMVALGPSDQPNTLDLDKLFVEPRRIRTGVGRALLAYAISEARRRGADRLTILADPYAAGFYERNGARLIGQAPSDAIPGRSLPLYEIKLD